MATDARTRQSTTPGAGVTRTDRDRPSPARQVRRVNERFRRENRHYVRQFIGVQIARICSWIARSMPTSTRYWIADRLGDLMYWLIPGYRENVRSNLTHVYGPGIEIDSRGPEVRRVFRTSARNWSDLLVVPGRSAATFDAEVEVAPEDRAHLDAALAQGNGCVIITAHLGAFDYLGHYLHSKGYKLSIVTGRTTARIVFDAVTFLRQSNGLGLVEATPSGVRAAIQAVRNGECAVFVTDRDFFQNGIQVTFFGAMTTLPPGAVRIARDSRAPIVPIFARRSDQGHKITIHPPINVPKTDDLQRDLLDGMSCVVASLERAISSAPDQWVMFQSVWPSAPGDHVA
jgi:KDO2-lipid IV(A) lauroyltransferase